MLKFKFNYLKQTLSYQTPFSETWQEVEEQFEGNFGSLGFQLGEGWISFTIYEKKIVAFYKQRSVSGNPNDFWEPQTIAYFKKDLPKQEEVIFAFVPADQVEKREGRWVKKGEGSM